MTGERHMGESRAVIGHPTKTIHINERAANKLALLVSEELKWPLYYIRYTHRDTKRVCARVWPAARRVIVNIPGENVCTILHELAHHTGVHHDYTFKNTHRKLLKLWEDKWERKFTLNIIPAAHKPEPRIPESVWKYQPKPKAPVYPKTSLVIQKVAELLNQAKNELIEDTIGIVISPAVVGRKLVELGINNVDNLNKIKQMLRETGRLVIA